MAVPVEMLRTIGQEASINWQTLCCGGGLIMAGIFGLARHISRRRNTRNLGGGVTVERYPGNRQNSGVMKFGEGDVGGQVVRGLDQDAVEKIFSPAPKKTKGKKK